MSQITPYDTGKVKIGVYYQRPVCREMSRDALLIQDALLRTGRRTNQKPARSFFSSVAFRFQRWMMA